MSNKIKTLLLTLFIVLLSVTSISAAPSTTAGNGGVINTITTSPDKTDPIVNKLPDLKDIPTESNKVETGYTTISTEVQEEKVKQNIVKPGLATDIVVDKKTNVTTVETTTEYGSYTKTVIDNNTGIITSDTTKADGTTINVVKDINVGVSTTVETTKEGKVTTTTTDLKTGVATSISEKEDGTLRKVITVPNGAPAPEGLTVTETNNQAQTTEGKPLTVNIENNAVVFVADVFELEVSGNGEELISSRQKYVEITKVPLALDEKSKDVEGIRSDKISLLPKNDILSKVDNNLLAPSTNYISEDSYMSDFYELQVYLKEGENKELTHEGIEITISLPEYVTDDVDAERSGIVHYEQSENIYEFVLFDSVDYENKTVTFTLRSTSPISYVFRYKNVEPAEVIPAKCRLHWIILLSIIIYIIAALLIQNKKKFFPLVSIVEALIAIIIPFITKEFWCIVLGFIALIVIVILVIMIRNANKEEDEE